MFVLEPEILCMEYLWNRSAKWKYFINLTGLKQMKHNSYILKLSNYLAGKLEMGKVVTPCLARYVNWSWDKLKCHGKYVHSVCIHGARVLPAMKDSKKLFVNKFHQEFHPLAYDCLEELLFNRTRDRHFGLSSFNTSFYSNLDFVKNRVEP
ncbi:GCNT2-like protein [Mya arenaria]|uniref:GCNT2-like protein n=1 Tax=Mya arenaria TaxID=6604 RepID=A0ABY7FKT9_MYAAR|nr:GCNT2-like protein [Mya arenaria]